MRVPHQINLAFRECSFRRIANILTIGRRLKLRRQLAELPHWLKRNSQSTPDRGEEPGTHRFHDAARIHTADGEVYFFPDGTSIDCRTRK